jgi:hypothetical protein
VTAGEDTFTVPAGVTGVHVLAVGATGEKGANVGPSHGGHGGDGAQVIAEIPVAPGRKFNVEVGVGGGSAGGNGGQGGGLSGTFLNGCSAGSTSTACAVVVAGGGGGGGGAFFDGTYESWGTDGGAGRPHAPKSRR